jgi:hypothetical protein
MLGVCCFGEIERWFLEVVNGFVRKKFGSRRKWLRHYVIIFLFGSIFWCQGYV